MSTQQNKIFSILLILFIPIFIGGISDGVTDDILDEVRKVIKDGYDSIKLEDQNRAYGELMFGDSLEAVVAKLKKDGSLEVTYPSYDGGVVAGFNIGETEFTLSPEFYNGKLYKVVLNGLLYDSSYCYRCAERDFYTLVKVITEKYGPPDVVGGESVAWRCGRKFIFVGVFGRRLRATCWIVDKIVKGVIDKQEQDQDQEEIHDKSKYF